MEIHIEQPKTRASSKCWGCSPDKIDSAHFSQQTKILEEDIEIKELYVRMKSAVDEGPFHETKYQTQTQDLSYKAELHMDVFLEFLAYHLLFFFAMGPLIVVLFVRRMPLYYNLGFWSWKIDCFFQVSLWLGSIFCTLVYFLTGLLSDLEIGILWFSVFFRCVIASTRFATMNIDRVDTYRMIRLPEKTTKFDTVLFDWAEQSQKIQLLEIVRAIKRHDFDTSEFYINFLVPPMDDTEKAINAIKIDQEDREDSFSGCKMFSYFIHSFQKQQTRKHIKVHSLIITLVIVLSSKMLRLGYYDVIVEEIVINVIASLFQTLSLNCMFIYLHLSIDDLKRKYFTLEQCLYLISTKRCKCNENKLTPTINFNDLKTIESWSMLRSLSFDYGANYDLRSQLYLTVLLTISMFAIIFSLQMILGYFVLDNTIVIPLSILVGMFFCFFLNYLIKAAMINEQFVNFQTQLENLKFIYMDIKRMRDSYFKTSQEPQSFIHRSFVIQLRELYATDYQRIYRAIDDAIEGLDDCLRQNEYDSRNFPFKVYGIKITYELLYSVGMGLFTVYSFAIQQRFSSQ